MVGGGGAAPLSGADTAGAAAVLRDGLQRNCCTAVWSVINRRRSLAIGNRKDPLVNFRASTLLAASVVQQRERRVASVHIFRVRLINEVRRGNTEIGGDGGVRKGVGGLPCPVVAAVVVTAGAVGVESDIKLSPAVGVGGVGVVVVVFGTGIFIITAAAGRCASQLLRRAWRSPAEHMKEVAGTARHSPARQTCKWRRSAKSAGAEKNKLTPACRCAMRGKEAAHSASGAEAQGKAEDDGQEASDVHRRVGVGLLPAVSFGGSR